VCTCAGTGFVHCGAVCTNPTSDPEHCGNCNNVCAVGDVCTNGVCSCNGMMCGGNCVNLQSSPNDCGMCGTACNNNQACLTGACACRPGLTSCNGMCVDVLADPLNCGACGTICNFLMGQRCVDGQCQMTTCGALGRTNCNGGCLTMAQLGSSPLHCGACFNACAVDEVCVQGACTAYFAPTCNACPCPACGASTTCCSYPGTTVPICVTGGTCP
jgi:hypothetical protein